MTDSQFDDLLILVIQLLRKKKQESPKIVEEDESIYRPSKRYRQGIEVGTMPTFKEHFSSDSNSILTLFFLGNFSCLLLSSV